MIAGAALGQRFGIAATVNLAVVTVAVSAVLALTIPRRHETAPQCDG
jgi:hypothetical protein